MSSASRALRIHEISALVATNVTSQSDLASLICTCKAVGELTRAVLRRCVLHTNVLIRLILSPADELAATETMGNHGLWLYVVFTQRTRPRRPVHYQYYSNAGWGSNFHFTQNTYKILRFIRKKCLKLRSNLIMHI
jgi:hypothetical protein